MPLKLLLLAALLAPQDTKLEAPREKTAFIIPIVGMIDYTQHAFIKRATEEARGAKADVAVFEIDSPGGRIDAMEAIARQIFMTEEAGILTIAFIRPAETDTTMGGAYSAAAYLALCCRKMYVYPGQHLGDAQPIMIGPEGIIELPEKAVSPMRAKFHGIAEQRGYPPRLAEAMVDKDLEVFDVNVDGERKFLTMEEVLTAKNEGRRVEYSDVPVVKKGQLLTLTESQIVAYGFAKRAQLRAEIYADLGLEVKTETPFAFSWSEALVDFLTSPIVATLLLIVGILGIWIELKTPGFGVPGIAGIAAFAILLFGHHLAGLAEMTEILLFVVGVGLVGVEIFLLPGTGVFAILGVLCIFSGLILSFQDFVLPASDSPWQATALVSSVGRVLMGFLASSVCFVVLIRFLPNVPLLNRAILSTELSKESGAVAPSQAVSEMLVGKTGLALTQLRPSGKIEIGGAVYDVVTDGAYVAKGDPVTVIAIDGSRIVVSSPEKA